MTKENMTTFLNNKARQWCEKLINFSFGCCFLTRSGFLWQNMSSFKHISLTTGSYIITSPRSSDKWLQDKKQKLLFSQLVLDFGRVNLWLCRSVPLKKGAVIWFSHTLKGLLFVSCASEIGWWVLLEISGGEMICIHLLYLNGAEEGLRKKVELQT